MSFFKFTFHCALHSFADRIIVEYVELFVILILINAMSYYYFINVIIDKKIIGLLLCHHYYIMVYILCIGTCPITWDTTQHILCDFVLVHIKEFVKKKKRRKVDTTINVGFSSNSPCGIIIP